SHPLSTPDLQTPKASSCISNPALIARVTPLTPALRLKNTPLPVGHITTRSLGKTTPAPRTLQALKRGSTQKSSLQLHKPRIQPIRLKLPLITHHQK
ncbi:MAG: hypothetical protein GSR81_08610, partial [Desulfurococcales archaeon]|nr:hypothetical protein [Desulfurococcales archaeon]